MTNMKDIRDENNRLCCSEEQMYYVKQQQLRVTVAMSLIIIGILGTLILILYTTIFSMMDTTFLTIYTLIATIVGFGLIMSTGQGSAKKNGIENRDILYTRSPVRQGNTKKNDTENKDIVHPRIPVAYLLSWLPKKYQECLTGDLEEEFLDKQSELGHTIAVLWYCWQVLTTLYTFLLDIGRKVIKWVT